jgi:hypothetical protein
MNIYKQTTIPSEAAACSFTRLWAEKRRGAILLGLLLVTLRLAQADDLNVTGNLVVTGAGDIRGNTFNLGSWSTDATQPGVVFTFADAPTANASATFTLAGSRPKQVWLWQQNSATGMLPMMKLDSGHRLTLYDVAGNGDSANVILDPAGTSVFQKAVNFNGTDNQMPSQTLTGAATVLTANLGDQRYLRSGTWSLTFGRNSTASGADAVALGFGLVSSGDQSSSFGQFSNATGSIALAAGRSSVASGPVSTAMGYSANASGYVATAFGHNTSASEWASIAMGDGTSASGNTSTAMGVGTSASSNGTTALGEYTTASGNASIAMNCQTVASGPLSTAMGWYSTASGNTAFAAGQGSNASGLAATAIGTSVTANGERATAFGEWTTSSGHTSITMGGGTGAGGSFSTAAGHSSSATGWSSTALGEGANATGIDSIATGSSTASGVYSTSFGLFTVAQGYATTVTGRYNIPQGDGNNWVATDDLFTVGNGTDANNRSNAFVVKKNGDAIINGKTNIKGGLVVSGTADESGTIVAVSNQLVLIPQQGDLAMGEFTGGAKPQ